MVNRVIWIVVLLLGLMIGICGGLEQAILGRSIYLIHEATEDGVAPNEEARQGLGMSFNMTTVSMYLGVAVGIAAVVGLSMQDKRGRHADSNSVGQ